MRPELFHNPAAPRQKIAVIGGGIAGNSAAWALARTHDVTLYEAEARFGGHSNTVIVEHAGAQIPVDTGFIVYNERNYPNLIRLFDHLGVATEASNMSFGVSLDQGAFEYKSDRRPSALFARKRNALSPRFWRMLQDIVRFYKVGPHLADRYDVVYLSLGDLLTILQVSDGFIRDHIVPMTACIWSASFSEVLRFPAASFIRFFTNHGLFEIKDRPQWRTVSGGSQAYVEKLLADIPGTCLTRARVRAVERQSGMLAVHADGQPCRTFDQVVMATHADDTLQILTTPTARERQVLSAFGYSSNQTFLHTDPRAMPRRRAVWSSWNYVAPRSLERDAQVPITYWMNRLQNLTPDLDIFVSLNPTQPIAPNRVIYETNYRHPIFDAAAIAAQKHLPEIQGQDSIWFCGSYHGYGFHEDACASGLAVARALGGYPAWETPAHATLVA
jgi:uncharacterized protein